MPRDAVDSRYTSAPRSGSSNPGARPGIVPPDSTPPAMVLDPAKIIETVDTLRLRIRERFPGSGLLKICEACLDIARRTRERSEAIDRPIYWLRGAIWLIIIAITLGTAAAAVVLPQRLLNFTENWETIEALTSETLLLAAGLFFLMSLERRYKQRRALQAIHELRAVAHVVDMHQLTKDPERLVTTWVGSAHSPKMNMTAFELGRYLDYCTELLSIIGKIAAVYVQKFDDEVALEAANEVQNLTSSLCERIWQKTMLLQAYAAKTISAADRRGAGSPQKPPESTSQGPT